MKITVEQITDFGTEEPWVARLQLGIAELLSSTNLFVNTQGVIDAFGDVFEELESAFLALRRITQEPQPLLKSELKKEYSNLYDRLWAAYKDRFSIAAEKMGYSIGFLYQTDSKFENQSLQYFAEKDLPQELRKMMKLDRQRWQNALGDLRNDYIQHRSLTKGIESIWFDPKMAKVTFENVWQAIEDVTALLIQHELSKVSSPVVIAEIPENDRDQACPKRFVLSLSPHVREALEASRSD